MKVVLKQDVKKLGKKDELHEVSDGYARNFLIPRGLAIEADNAAIHEVKAKESSRKHKEEMERAEAEKLAASLEGKTVVVHAKGGQSGRLFGAVTVKDIAKALAGQGIEIDKRKLSTEAHEIKDFGSYEVTAKVAAGITAKFTCKVEE
ncbi:50S ribosomal protein L9 [Ruminococcaceae bacterium OttesenSCG-928-I18]|nr:50S ribosomal protein L9 [Ruminococcaceae bacterium OttesenSCG-928-I18]